MWQFQINSIGRVAGGLLTESQVSTQVAAGSEKHSVRCHFNPAGNLQSLHIFGFVGILFPTIVASDREFTIQGRQGTVRVSFGQQNLVAKKLILGVVESVILANDNPLLTSVVIAHTHQPSRKHTRFQTTWLILGTGSYSILPTRCMAQTG
jgi:hypothetical protein